MAVKLQKAPGHSLLSLYGKEQHGHSSKCLMVQFKEERHMGLKLHEGKSIT